MPKVSNRLEAAKALRAKADKLEGDADGDWGTPARRRKIGQALIFIGSALKLEADAEEFE